MIIKDRKTAFSYIAFLAVLNLLAWITVFYLDGPRPLIVDFFDVGQDDSAFIRKNALHQVLLDGGPGSAVLEKMASWMPFWDKTIGLIILTYPEKDHL